MDLKDDAATSKPESCFESEPNSIVKILSSRQLKYKTYYVEGPNPDPLEEVNLCRLTNGVSSLLGKTVADSTEPKTF